MSLHLYVLSAAAAAAAGVTPGGILVTATDSVRSRNFLKRAKAAAEQLTAATAVPATATATGVPAGAGGPPGAPEEEDDTPKADPTAVVKEAAAAVEAAEAAAAAAGKGPLTATERKDLLHAELEAKIGLKPEDVILAVEGVDVAGDGTIHFRSEA